jgi:uncharacterized protein (TIGR03085 family)
MQEKDRHPAQSERLLLCGLLEDKGPLAPTLCEGWTTADLAAHLFIRENRPWYGIGILVKPLSGLTEKGMEEAKRSFGYTKLIDKVRSGPPGPLKALDEQMNLVEYFVHHEDVRRATGEAEPRSEPALEAALWRALSRSAWLLSRRLRGVGLTLVAPGFGSVSARKGTPLVTMTGPPGELLVYLFGRKSAAKVTFDGESAALGSVEEAQFGL